MKLMTVMKKTVDCVRLRSSKIAFKRKISQDFVTFLCSLLWNQLCSLLYTFQRYSEFGCYWALQLSQRTISVCHMPASCSVATAFSLLEKTTSSVSLASWEGDR